MDQKRTAIVTGAASGLGLEFTKLLASDAYHVIMVDKDPEALEKAKDEISKNSKTNIECFCVDLCAEGAIQQIAGKVSDKPVEVLINNAGFGLYGPFVATPWEVEEQMIRLHVNALTHLSKLVLKDMLHRNSGQIMNISSMASFQPGPLMAVYYATKAYITWFSVALSNEVKGSNVTVTVLCPGLVPTNFQSTAAIHSGSKMVKPGRFSATAASVAKQGYRAMLKGKPLAVPGLLNKITYLVSKLMPMTFSAALIARIQKQIRR